MASFSAATRPASQRKSNQEPHSIWRDKGGDVAAALFVRCQMTCEMVLSGYIPYGGKFELELLYYRLLKSGYWGPGFLRKADELTRVGSARLRPSTPAW